MTSGTSWHAGAFLQPANDEQTALVLLNAPLVHSSLFRQIWHAATVRYCADGGANRLYDSYRDDGDDFLPTAIIGDLDSLRPDVRLYYENKSIPVLHDPSQDTTDLGKCTAYHTQSEQVASSYPGMAGKQLRLVILGGLSGRLDQTIHTIHALTKLHGERELGTWVVGRESVACILGTGRHTIEMPLEHFGETCAVLPIGEEAKVTTKGLRWDFGPGLWPYPTSIKRGVSSSNHLTGQVIEIETDVPVVWTAEVRGGAE